MQSNTQSNAQSNAKSNVLLKTLAIENGQSLQDFCRQLITAEFIPLFAKAVGHILAFYSIKINSIKTFDSGAIYSGTIIIEKHDVRQCPTELSKKIVSFTQMIC